MIRRAAVCVGALVAVVAGVFAFRRYRAFRSADSLAYSYTEPPHWETTMFARLQPWQVWTCGNDVSTIRPYIDVSRTCVD